MAAVTQESISDARSAIQSNPSPAGEAVQSPPNPVTIGQPDAGAETSTLDQVYNAPLPAAMAKRSVAFEAAPGFEKLPQSVDDLVRSAAQNVPESVEALARGAVQSVSKNINPVQIIRRVLIGWGINAALVGVTLVAVGIAIYSLIGNRSGNPTASAAATPEAPAKSAAAEPSQAASPAPYRVLLPSINLAPITPSVPESEAPVASSGSPPIRRTRRRVALPVPPPPVVVAPPQTAPEPANDPLRPIPRTHTLPPYPPQSVRLNEQGTTLLAIDIGTDGIPDQCSIDQSSGSARLDHAACVHIVSHWRWEPPTKGGQPTSVRTRVSIKWDLRDVR